MIYFMTRDGNTIGILDTTTHIFSVLMDISTSFPEDAIPWNKYKQGIVVGVDKKYLVPGNANEIGLLTLLLSGNTFEHLVVLVQGFRQGEEVNGGVLLNSKIYMVPRDRHAIDVVDLNLEACTACGVHTYSAEYETSACSTCPTLVSSLLNASTFDRCVCDAGYTGPDPGTCTACVLGKYKGVVGSAACAVCPTTLTTSAEASLNATDCMCGTGYSGPVGGPCTLCVSGTHKIALGYAACTQHQEITLVYICRIRMRLYVNKSLNDIYMSNNF